MSERTLKVVYAICLGQFVLVLLFVRFFCQPITRTHMAWVGLSLILGLLVSGTVRRNYQAKKAEGDQQKKYAELDQALRKIREEENKKD